MCALNVSFQFDLSVCCRYFVFVVSVILCSDCTVTVCLCVILIHMSVLALAEVRVDRQVAMRSNYLPTLFYVITSGRRYCDHRRVLVGSLVHSLHSF